MDQLFADVPSFHHGHKGCTRILQALGYSLVELQIKGAHCKLSTSTILSMDANLNLIVHSTKFNIIALTKVMLSTATSHLLKFLS